MVSTRGVFAGDTSLLIHCMEAWLAADHTVVAVISTEHQVVQWAVDRAVRIAPDSATFALDSTAEFDLLICLESGRTWPQELAARARIMAVLFHDSLSTRHLAPYAASWALIDQEKTHGVAWYQVDPGGQNCRIAVEQSFEISQTETAWSLQAKCYEAGLASFMHFVGCLPRQSPPPAPTHAISCPQTDPFRRPPRLGTLDFSRGAEEVAGLIAGLDFGPNPNLLGSPKIYLGSKFATVHSAQILNEKSKQPAGFVVSFKDDSLRVSTGDRDIVLTGCACIARQSLDVLFSQDRMVPKPAPELVALLELRTPALARGELYWREAYRQIAPVELPYPTGSGESHAAGENRIRLDLPPHRHASATVGAFLAWLAALTGRPQVSVLFSDAELETQVGPLGCWLSAWVPMTLALDAGKTAQQVFGLAEQKISAMHQAGPCTRDLPLRFAAGEDALQRLRKIGVCTGRQALPSGMGLLLAGGTSKDHFELIADDTCISLATLQLIASHFSIFVRNFEEYVRIGDASLVPVQEALEISAINRTFLPRSDSSGIADLIETQAMRTPEHIALRCEGLTLTYHELERRATALAGRLQRRGVLPDNVVGLCIGRGLELVVSLLAILKTGAAYLPLDPEYPPDRLTFMTQDSQTSLVLTTRALAPLLPIASEKVFLLDTAEGDGGPPEQIFVKPFSNASAAYLMYTSGSTGRPKGVRVTQQNVLNLFAGLNARIPHQPPGSWLAIGSLSFDISVPELWWTLSQGFTVVVHAQSAPRWSVSQALLQHGITHFLCTPSMASMLMADDAGRKALARLSVLMVGGEALPLQLARDLCNTVDGRVFNIYGPTETTVLSTLCELSADESFVSLGQPIANTTLSVRTEYGAECPLWVAGELLIGGAGVSDGYWRQPALTEERFLADPACPGGRLYRTGDLVRRRPAGGLEFLGRIDHQVKIRGHRIELGEIENVMSQLPAIKDAVVLAPADRFGDRRLIAYVVPKADALANPKLILTAVATKLPAIMVPTSVVVLRNFPLNPNGKVDRSALPVPRLAPADRIGAAFNPLEKLIAEAWGKALGQDWTSASENFFHLGGALFSAVKVQQYLRHVTGQLVHLDEMVRFPTVRTLAQHLASGSGWPLQGTGQAVMRPATSGPDTAGRTSFDLPEAVAPEILTEVESAVARLWGDLFELDGIRKDDDFFDLGGNSLAAVRMFAQLRKQFPGELPLATLFKSSSLAGFAALVEASMRKSPVVGGTAFALPRKKSPNQKDWSPLVPICAGDGQHEALFCIHGAGGNVFNFKGLSQKMGGQQAIYGLQPQGVDGHLPALDSIEAMAAQYVKAIRTVDPTGPYRLLGYSAGGVIAFEMARQFRRSGGEVAFLAMIDTLTPAAAIHQPGFFTKLWLMRHWSLKFALERSEHRRIKQLNDSNYEEVAQKLARDEWLMPELVELYLFRHIVDVQGKYKPPTQKGPVVVYQAIDATTQYLHAGRYLGWDAHVDGEIKVIPVSGSHSSMMTDPGLSELATSLENCLARIEEKPGDTLPQWPETNSESQCTGSKTHRGLSCS